MNKYMKIANELAQQNILTNHGGPFGAVIVKDGVIVGKGNNQVVLKNDPTAHAEIVAIRDACKTLNTFNLTGCEIYLDIPSVGATENLMLAAILADGTTTIQNAAREPEIIDLANFLNAMGADVVGAGTSDITINGVKQEDLHEIEYTTIPDRIEAGTFMTAVVATRGKALIKNIFPAHLTFFTNIKCYNSIAKYAFFGI